MTMKKLLLFAAVICAALFSSCGDKYDDTALKNEMESLKDRVAQLEAKLTQEVNTLKGLIKAAEEGLAVSVEEVDGGYDVTIGNETFTIYHGTDGENGTDGTNGTNGTVITVVEVDGVYYWAINGEATEYPVTGNDGKDGEDGEDGAPGQNGYTPEIKDGKWYINGEEVGPAVGENGKDGDSFFKNVTVNEDNTVTFTLADDTTITVALAKSAKYNDVQSIKFVPEYSDGKVTVGYYTGAADAFVVAKYEVTPKAAAATIAKYADDASMQAVYTKSRAEAGELVVLPVTTIEAEEGIITVTATAADLAEEFFAGTLEASVRFAVQDDLSGNASEYVAAVAAKVEMPEFTATAVAEGYQGVKLTWTEIPAAAYYQVKSSEAVVVEKVEGATEVVVENLTDTNKYAFTVVAYTAKDAELTSADTEEVEIWTLYNWTEPVFELKSVENGYQFIASNLTNVNYAYGGAVTNDVDDSKSSIEIYKDNELVYVLKNGTGQGTLKAWAGYKRWALNAQDNRKDWTWYDAEGNMVSTKADGSLGEVNTVPASFFKGGEYTIKYKIGYVVNKNGHWAKSAKVEDIVANREDGAAVVFFANGLNDVLRQENGDVTIIAKEGTSSQTFTIEQTWNVTASIDNGTEPLRMVFKGWNDWHTYGWHGLRSVNGQLETVNLSWDEIPEVDKVVIEYLGETVEVTTGLPFHIVTGLKTSPVEFTITAYKGADVLATATTSSDVYTLPETAAGTFNATYSAEKGGWTITGEDFNTTQYATWNCSFNIYEKGSDTPVFENNLTKNGENSIPQYAGWIANHKVETSKNTHAAFHVGAGEWDQGTVHKGLKGNTEYEVRFELGVFPYIYDAENAGNDVKTMYYKKVLIGTDRTQAFGAIKLAGTTSFTTGEGPAAFEVRATINDGTERIQTQYTDGHRGFKAINGIYEAAKLSWTANDAIAKVVVKYNDGTAEQTKTVTASEWTVAEDRVTYTVEGIKAHKATFNVEAFDGNDASLGTAEVETDIYHLATPELVFATKKLDSGEWQLTMSQMSNGYNSFYYATFNIYKDGVALFDTPLAKNLDNTSTGTLNAWIGNRGCNSWLSTSDFDGGIKTIAADKLAYSTEYEVRYTLTAWPTIPDAAAQAANHHNHAEWFYWSSILLEPQTVAEVSTTFTTEAAPAPTFDLAGNYTKSYFEIDVDAKNGNSWTDGTFNGGPTSFTSVEATTDGGPAWKTKYNKYGLTLHFDIDSAEIADMPGCYALINLKDRNMDNGDKIVDHGSHYNSTTGEIVFKFVIESSSAPGGHNGGTLEEAGVTVPGWAIGVTMTPAQ